MLGASPRSWFSKAMKIRMQGLLHEFISNTTISREEVEDIIP